MVTIEEVARTAGVSVATVSRVLNNSATVKPATAEKVKAAIQNLAYTPNQSARNLRRNESRVILTLAPNFSNPYYSRILTGIGDLAHDLGYSVLICNTAGEVKNEKQSLKMLETHRADGAIFLGCHRDSQWLREYAAKYPIVQCCEYVPGLSVPSVSIDNYRAAYETVTYLSHLGHTRIGMLSADNDYISTSLRYQGYRDALQAAGLSVSPRNFVLADADYSFPSGFSAVSDILKGDKRPTAIFCVSDILALSAISAAEEAGLSVPQDLTVSGFDDVDYTTMFHPYLTTVAQPCYEMGQRSLELLLEYIRDPQKAAEQLFVPYTLTVRESSGSCPAPNTMKEGFVYA